MSIHPSSQNIAAAWRKRAEWLTRWTMAHLVNRTDIWGKYLAVDKRTAAPDGSMRLTRIAPSAAKRGKLSLNEKIILRHYQGEQPGHLVGIHSASATNHSKWLAIDLDPQSADGQHLINLRAATHWKDELLTMGFRPVLLDVNGAGGYLLLVLLRDPTPTARVNEFAQRLVRDYSDLGLARVPNVHPAGPAVTSSSWIRLPGRNPTSDVWTRVWNGHQWLDGSDAIERLLGAHGDAPALVRKLSAAGPAPAPAEPAAAAILPTAASPVSAHGRRMEHDFAESSTAFASALDGARSRLIQPDGKITSDATPLSSTDQCETDILAHLLNASRNGDEATSFAMLNSAGLDDQAFAQADHRRIFRAMASLQARGQRLLPTVIADEIPEEHRSAALAIIDELILHRAIPQEVFANHVAHLSPAHPPGSVSAGDSPADPALEVVISAWPRLTPAIRQAINALIRASEAVESAQA